MLAGASIISTPRQSSTPAHRKVFRLDERGHLAVIRFAFWPPRQTCERASRQPPLSTGDWLLVVVCDVLLQGTGNDLTQTAFFTPRFVFCTIAHISRYPDTRYG